MLKAYKTSLMVKIEITFSNREESGGCPKLISLHPSNPQ